MPKTFHVTANNTPEVFRDVDKKGGIAVYKFDASSWAEEYGAITSAAWTVESGQAAVANEALASGVASAKVTFAEAGRSLIQVKLDTGTELVVVHLSVMAKDPWVASEDYGFVH